MDANAFFSYFMITEFDGGGQQVKREFSCSFSLSRGVLWASLALSLFTLSILSPFCLAYKRYLFVYLVSIPG